MKRLFYFLSVGLLTTFLILNRYPEIQATRNPGIAQSNLTGTILFERGSENPLESMRLDNTTELYSLDLTTNQVTRLTNNSSYDGYCCWSPDGKQIVFTSNRSNAKDSTHNFLELYLMNVDGSGVRQLTQNKAADYPNPQAWSPDGSKLVIDSHRDGDPEIYIMDLNGKKEVRRLTNSKEFDGNAAWSPDGSKILFRSHRSGKLSLYVMNLDGSNPTLLMESASQGIWSPDGKQIVFTGVKEDGNIYIMNADGSGKRQLTKNPGDNYWPTWSPNGKQICFNRIYNGKSHIFSINVDGSNEKQLTNTRSYDLLPTWKWAK